MFPCTLEYAFVTTGNPLLDSPNPSEIPTTDNDQEAMKSKDVMILQAAWRMKTEDTSMDTHSRPPYYELVVEATQKYGGFKWVLTMKSNGHTW